jgi:hypothetical protein
LSCTGSRCRSAFLFVSFVVCFWVIQTFAYPIFVGHISDGVWETALVLSTDFVVLGLVFVKASAHLRLFEIACLTRLIHVTTTTTINEDGKEGMEKSWLEVTAASKFELRMIDIRFLDISHLEQRDMY